MSITKVKFGNFQMETTGSQVLYTIEDELIKAQDVNPNSFGESEFLRLVKKVANANGFQTQDIEIVK